MPRMSTLSFPCRLDKALLFEGGIGHFIVKTSAQPWMNSMFGCRISLLNLAMAQGLIDRSRASHRVPRVEYEI